MSDPSQSPFATACQTYPHLHAFMRLHTMRPFMAQRLRGYRMAALQVCACSEGEAIYLDECLTLAKEHYVSAMVLLHQLLIEIVMLDTHNKKIQVQCLYLIHYPLPIAEHPPSGLKKVELGPWFEGRVVDIDISIEQEYLALIDDLIRLVREKLDNKHNRYTS